MDGREERIPTAKLARASFRRRFGGYLSLLAVSVLTLPGAQAASAATGTTVTPQEGCPGDIVTFKGSGFKSGRTALVWVDFGIKEQFGPELYERESTDA